MSSVTEQEQERLFEDEVRRIARALWPEAEYDGAVMIDGRERDGVFVTEDCFHLIECTVSRSRQKAEDDAQKLSALSKKLLSRQSQKAVKSWFVTKEEPTADQRSVIREKHPGVTPLAFSHFQAKLVDAASYLNLRDNYPFGSVRDPATGDAKVQVEYIALDVVERATQKPWSVGEIQLELLKGGRFIIFADYGSGKSMTLREIFRELRQEYRKGKTAKFPVYLNLRDHFGQTNPAEALERHARNIGFSNPSHLVRAWRAGFVVLLIDGFDELTTLGIQGLWKRLHDVRYRAMEVVRRFVKDQPSDVGLILAGREHFFDSERERRGALGAGSRFTELSLNEFNDEQIKRYLAKKGLNGAIPDWIPSRPLLVGYLAASGVLEKAIAHAGQQGVETGGDPVSGWDFLLDRICAREADIEAGIDGPTVRRILERLATYARQNQSGLGPLSPETISGAFNEICGYYPDEKGSLLLQRLPGLGIERADEGTRTFLDESFVDVCRAADTAAFLADPFGSVLNMFKGADHGLDDLGVACVLVKADGLGLSSGKLIPATRKAMELEDTSCLLLDIIRVGLEARCGFQVPIELSSLFVRNFEITPDVGDCSDLTFADCLFSRLSLDHGCQEDRLPKFHSCYIDELDGRSSINDLPKGVFDRQCEFGRFSEAPETTRAIGEMNVPLGVRVLLAVLKKIYLQSGSGRKENALARGLDHHSRRLVGSVLKLLNGEGIIAPYKRAGLDMTIWVPVRSNSARVQKVLTSPNTCGDSLIQKAANIR